MILRYCLEPCEKFCFACFTMPNSKVIQLRLPQEFTSFWVLFCYFILFLTLSYFPS